MIGTFKTSNPINVFLLLVYGLLLKLPMFLYPTNPTAQLVDGFLYKALLKWLQPFTGNTSIIYAVISFALLFTQALSLNKLVNDLRLLQKPNYLTGMSYLLVTSLFADWNTLSASLIINTILIWVWSRMSLLQSNAHPKAALFNIGIAIGLCTFFYFPSLSFATLIIFGLFIIRPFKLSEWLIALLGIITPYYFLLAIVFLTDKWKGYHFPGIAITSPKFNQTHWSYTAIFIVVLASVFGLFFVQQNFRRQLIQTRKSWNLLFLYLLIALFVPFINATHSFEYWILSAVPLSTLLGATFFYPQRKIIPQILHWLMVALVIVINYIVR